MNLVSGFHALGTLLAVGIMMLPAVIARFWARDITAMIADRGRSAARLGLCRAAAVVPCRRAVRTRHHSGRAACSTPSRCCSAASAAMLRQLFPGTPSRSVRMDAMAWSRRFGIGVIALLLAALPRRPRAGYASKRRRDASRSLATS